MVAASLVATASAIGLNVLAPDPPGGEPLVVAVGEVPAGAVLEVRDLRVTRRPAAEVPDGALRDVDEAVGRTLGSGLRTGEPLTDARLVGDGLLVGRPVGEVAAPVRIADVQAAGLAEVGDRVDVLAATAEGTGARRVVERATVLARPDASSSDGLLDDGGAGGGLLVLAVSGQAADDLAQASVRGPLSLVFR